MRSVAASPLSANIQTAEDHRDARAEGQDQLARCTCGAIGTVRVVRGELRTSGIAVEHPAATEVASRLALWRHAEQRAIRTGLADDQAEALRRQRDLWRSQDALRDAERTGRAWRHRGCTGRLILDLKEVG